MAVASSNKRSIQRHLRIGAVGALFLILGVGGWAATTELSSAVIAQGHLTAKSNVKLVQHPTGGMVVELNVQEGDMVLAGQVLARIDDVALRANLEIINQNIRQLEAKQARLMAELQGSSEISFVGASDQKADPEQEALLAAETKLFEVRRASLFGEQAQLQERVSQIKQEIDGLHLQVVAKEQERALVQRELGSVQQLLERKLVSADRASQLEKTLAQLEGQIGQLKSMAAQGAGRITETQLQMLQADHNFQSQVAEDLSTVRAQLSEQKERWIAVNQDLSKTVITAPQAGQAHGLAITAPGGVLAAGETFMRLVPTFDDLRADVRIAPQDIDQVRIGQKTVLRFSALNSRTTPEIYGVVQRLSADVTTEPQTGSRYYVAQVELEPSELSKLADMTLTIGMPVEAFIENASRSALTYIAKPLSDQMARSFRGE